MNMEGVQEKLGTVIEALYEQAEYQKGIQTKLEAIPAAIDAPIYYDEAVSSAIFGLQDDVEDLRDVLFVALLDTDEKKEAYEALRQSRKRPRD